MSKLGVLLVQLGSPVSPSTADVKKYLRDFLTDPRLIPQGKTLWWKLLLEGVILPTRSPKSAHAYGSIWKDGQSPLITHTEAFVELVRSNSVVPVEHSYAIGQGPRTIEAVQKLLSQGVEEILLVPLFPQFAAGTTLSAEDTLRFALRDLKSQVPWRIVSHFHTSQAYIANLVRLIQEDLDIHQPDRLLISFHSYPLKRVHDGDPYYQHCIETSRLICERLNYPMDQVEICFQSKLGRAAWLEPSTESTVIRMAAEGHKKIVVVCPAFVVDNLETLEEIDIGLREIFLEGGGEFFHTVTCLNDDPQWCEDFASQIQRPHREVPRLPVPPSVPQLREPGIPPAPSRISRPVKKTFALMAGILFLDSAGFSLIFPLFPHMLQHYSAQEGNSGGFFDFFLTLVEGIGQMAGVSGSFATIVLFGGLLAFVYGFLQFLAAPILGSWSDRIGRRPVLLFSMAGLSLSYLLWGFAGSFALLVISRILAGLMGSSITTASAVVADLTDSSNRAKGMAVLGISFGLGFVVGPLLGGIMSLVHLNTWLPQFAASPGGFWGLHPFSAAAFSALILSIIAWQTLHRKFQETLSAANKDRAQTSERSINPIKLFATSQYPGITRINWTHFAYLSAFAGGEFCLTFLTADRLNYTPAQNGLLFLYLGIILILVQGGYVRRVVHKVGEKRMVLRGLSILVPAMIAVAFAWNTWVLLLGLGLMAIGSAILSPCLNALASQYAPAHEQGRILGTFRSLGSLGRCIGPLLGALVYWKLDATFAYLWVALALLIPIFFIWHLPKRNETKFN
jgi:ferrochelatase